MPSKTVRVGSARIDERGQAKGGKAGDNNGRECDQQDWYAHPKGWVVLRPLSRSVGQKIAYDMTAACDNPHIGYDQGQRLTLYNVAKPYNFDCAKVAEDCETDCSALVRVCLAYAGIMVGNFTTANEASVLMATGKFMKLTDAKFTKSPDYLRAGDVLVTKSQGHTVVVLNDGLLGGDDADIPAPSNPVQPDGAIKATTVGNYWLREKPGVMGARIGVVKDSSSVLVYGRSPSNPEWYGVKILHTPNGELKGEKGYISHKALPGLEGGV